MHPEESATTGADLLVKALIDEEVEVVFGYPGGAVFRSTIRSSSRTSFATSSSAMSRRRCMPPRAMPARPARSAWCS